MSLLFFFFFSFFSRRKRVLFIGFPPVCHGFERRPEMFETVKNCYQECERWDQFKGRGHWADKICFAPPKVSTKFVSTNHCGRTEKQQDICLSLNVNHRDIQIEQYLNLGIQLKPKIHGSYNSCILSILSTDRYAASRARYKSSILTIWLPHKNEIYFGGLLPENSYFKSEHKFCWLPYSFKSWLVN